MFTFQMGMIVLFGTILGSFLNVCIYRLPRKESIVWPNSYCPTCKCSIPIWLNIPLISYIFLRGKCSNCKSSIPIIYPLVEIITAALLVLIWQNYGISQVFIPYAILVLILVTVSLIDWYHKLILNVLTFPGIVIGLGFALVINHITLLQAFLGLVFGGGFLWLIGFTGRLIFKKESMGAGDVKLAAMIGTFIGPQVVIALFLAFFLALPVIAIGLVSGRLKIGHSIPFGPFISIATVIIVCFGTTLYQFYFNFTANLIY